MARLRYTAVARADILAIGQYIARDNPVAARNVLRDLRDTCKLIASQPLIGEAQPTLARGAFRAFGRGNYIIYYQFDAKTVEIVRVVHGARQQDRLF